MSPPHRYSPAEWKSHVAIRKKRTFTKLSQAKIGWINESNFPDRIGKLQRTEHAAALQTMVDFAQKAQDRQEFAKNFGSWLSSKYRIE